MARSSMGRFTPATRRVLALPGPALAQYCGGGTKHIAQHQHRVAAAGLQQGLGLVQSVHRIGIGSYVERLHVLAAVEEHVRSTLRQRLGQRCVGDQQNPGSHVSGARCKKSVAVLKMMQCNK